MKQLIPVVLDVEFPDDVPQIDVDEAVADGMKRLQSMLMLAPALTGRSTRGKAVSFRIRGVAAAPRAESCAGDG